MRRVRAHRATLLCTFLVVLVIAMLGVATLASATPTLADTTTTVAAAGTTTASPATVTPTTLAGDSGGFATGYIVLIVVAVVLIGLFGVMLARKKKS